MSYAIALIYAYLCEHPYQYCSWVKPYSQIRPGKPPRVARVGGHWRATPHHTKLLRALACTCNFERIAAPVLMGPPPELVIPRYDEDGTLIPKAYRVVLFH